MIKRFLKGHKLDIVLASLSMLVMFYALFWNGSSGLSDNRDFDRILIMNGISYTVPADEQTFAYNRSFYMTFEGDTLWEKLVHTLFHLENPAHYPSIQHLFVKAAMAVNILLHRAAGKDIHTFRIEILGALYAILYAASLFALLSGVHSHKKLLDVLLKIIIVIAACDIGYISYFNSLYGEAPQIIFFVLSAAFGLRILSKHELCKRDVCMFYISLVLYAWSKFANLPVALATAVFVFPGLMMKGKKSLRKLTAAAAGISIAVLLLIYSIVPKWMDFQTNYNAVFFGILKDTEPAQAEQYLTDLALPSYMLPLADSNYYMQRVTHITYTDQFQADFAQFTKMDVARFYAAHPGYFLKKLGISAAHSGIIRPVYLSNYGLEKPRITFNRKFELWGTLRRYLPFDTWWWHLGIVIVFIFYMLLPGLSGRREESHSNPVLHLGLAAGILAGAVFSFCIPIITNGEADLAKHMFAYIQFSDFMTMIIIAVGLNQLAGLLEKGQKKSPAVRSYRLSAVWPLPVLILTACIYTGAGYIHNQYILHYPSRQLKTGSYVEFGSYQGRPLPWQIILQDEEGYTMIAAEAIASGSFSHISDTGSAPNGGQSGVPAQDRTMTPARQKYGSSLWTESRLRAWLNTEFLSNFTLQEQSMLLATQHRVLLSSGHTASSRGGWNDFFWSHLPKLADRGYDDAFYTECTDRVFLPNIQQIAAAARSGIYIRKETPYWLDTPYFSNDSMVRVVDTDGYIYMKDAKTTDIGIVPVIRVKRGFGARQ